MSIATFWFIASMSAGNIDWRRNMRKLSLWHLAMI
jgi:hypothetical protein